MVFANYQNCGGPICVGTEGGCGPFTYLWSNGFTGPCLMTYDSCVDLTVTVTDVNGCSVTLVVSPPTVSFINVVQPTCCQANGSLCVQACFGQGPLTYTWSNGATGP